MKQYVLTCSTDARGIVFLIRISSFSGDEERYKASSSLPDIPDIESKLDEVFPELA